MKFTGNIYGNVLYVVQRDYFWISRKNKPPLGPFASLDDIRKFKLREVTYDDIRIKFADEEVND